MLRTDAHGDTRVEQVPDERHHDHLLLEQLEDFRRERLPADDAGFEGLPHRDVESFHLERRLRGMLGVQARTLGGIETLLAFFLGAFGAGAAVRQLVQAARKMAEGAKAGQLDPSSITEESFSRHLYLPDVPDPDLMIRTSDETRISNFLLWQLAYAEIVVSPVLWPDFSRDEFHRCLNVFAGRNRRFGLTQEQAHGA